MAARLTFQEAREQLLLLSGLYRNDEIEIDEWCDGVHEVIAGFQAGRAVFPPDAATFTAAALPGVADPPQPGAVQVAVMIADRNTTDRHSVQHGTA